LDVSYRLKKKCNSINKGALVKFSKYLNSLNAPHTFIKYQPIINVIMNENIKDNWFLQFPNIVIKVELLPEHNDKLSKIVKNWNKMA
jgi:hypothetical protein